MNTNGSLTVSGQIATMVCGGPDDFHYNFGSTTVTGHVVANANVRVLNSTQQDIPIALAKFPGYLVSDVNIRVFTYSGSLSTITALSEDWHP